MSRAQGNQQLADYLFDTNVFEYYYRVLSWNKYNEDMKQQQDRAEAEVKAKAAVRQSK